MSTRTSKASAGTSDGQTGLLLSSRTIRLLKLSIVVMTILIAVGLIALVFGMKRQMNKLADKPPVVQTGEVNLPAGAVLQSVSPAQETGGLWLHLKTAQGGNQLMLVNAKGQLVRIMRLNQIQ